MAGIVRYLNKRSFDVIKSIFWFSSLAVILVNTASGFALDTVNKDLGSTSNSYMFLTNFNTAMYTIITVIQVWILLSSILVSFARDKKISKIFSITFSLYMIYVDKVCKDNEENITDSNSFAAIYIAYILTNINIIVIKSIIVAAAMYTIYR